jgi:hypothetical protein
LFCFWIAVCFGNDTLANIRFRQPYTFHDRSPCRNYRPFSSYLGLEFQPIAELIFRAIHLMPPFSEGVDYDPEKTNRKFVSVSAYIGYFRFDGFVRITEITTVDNFLAASKSEYKPIYDSTMDSPLEPSIKGINAPMVLLHQTQVTFSYSEP